MYLCDLGVGKISFIKKINFKEDDMIRLYDLGFIIGTKIKTILESKGIKAYLCRDSLIALRDIDAKNIIIEDIYD